MPQTIIYAAPRDPGAIGPPPAVATSGLARLFGHTAALAGVSLRVEPGTVVALLGPNGAGKTTLLRLLATAIRPSFGDIAIDGIDAVRHPELVRGRVAYLPHATGLYDDLTAAENLAFAVTLHGHPAADRADRVNLLLDEVGLATAADLRVRTFSAGMRKRLALARALAGRPSLVLLDEPHATLDAEAMALVDRLLGAWREAGVTVLLASHQRDRVTRLADASLELRDGLVAAVEGDGVTADLVPSIPLPTPATLGLDAR